MIRMGVLAAFASCLLVGTVPAAAEPMTLLDNAAVYARVIANETRDGRDAPDTGAPIVAQARGLRPYYVFERRDGWLRLGRTVREEGLFWIEEGATTPWEHNIVLTFTTRGLPGRALFLDSLQGVQALLDDETPHDAAADLRAQAIRAEKAMLSGTGDAVDSGPVNALGPKKGIDSRRNFYYLPILDFERGMFFNDDFTEAQALKVSILKQRPASAPEPLPSEQYRAGVAFVIDTTRSMGPYLDQTKVAIRTILEKIEKGPAADKFSFALGRLSRLGQGAARTWLCDADIPGFFGRCRLASLFAGDGLDDRKRAEQPAFPGRRVCRCDDCRERPRLVFLCGAMDRAGHGCERARCR